MAISWIEVEKALSDVKGEVLKFYMRIKLHNPTKPRRKDEIDPLKGIIYNPYQENYSNLVADALIRRLLLIIEAGTGIGKSIGYLVPILCLVNDHRKTQKRVIVISTSSIALQNQLKKDVEKVADLLKIDKDKLKIVISKGNRNYACQYCFANFREKVISSATSKITEEQLREISRVLAREQSWDRENIIGFLSNILDGNTELTNTVWKEIAHKDSIKCLGCDYRSYCHFLQNQATIGETLGPEIFITNHAKLAALLKQPDFVNEIDALVLDEAHAFPEQARAVYTKQIDLLKLAQEMDKEAYYLQDSNLYTTFNAVIPKIKILNQRLKKSANTILTYRNSSSNQLSDPNTKIINIGNLGVKKVIGDLNNLLAKLTSALSTSSMPSASRLLEMISPLAQITGDMIYGNNSSNLYWLGKNDSGEEVLSFGPKKFAEQFSPILRKNIPVVFTSATIRPSSVIKDELGLNDNNRLSEPEPIPSPFSYDDSLLYWDPNAKGYTDPDHIKDLAEHIAHLIMATEGKALILFTNKEEMKQVYDEVKSYNLDQKLILQGDNNASECAEEFRKDIDSCLFATGTFWQGVDFPGKTLSNLIITRLPFPQESPKLYAEKYQDGGSNVTEKYFDQMALMFRQAFGRAKRGPDDKYKIISCLDPRFDKYKDRLLPFLPSNIWKTQDIDDVDSFAASYILNKGEKQL